METEYKDYKEDCPTYDYVPSVIPPVKRIIAMGDIHGDYKLALAMFRIAKLIKIKGKKIEDIEWVGGETHVVQIGDMIDSKRPNGNNVEIEFSENLDDDGIIDSDKRIINFFDHVSKKAKEVGGRIIMLDGNHELLNVFGELSYVSDKGKKEFEDYIDPKNPDKKFISGEEARKYAFSVGHEYAEWLGCTHQSSVIIGSNIFVHAGLVQQFSSQMGNKDYDISDIVMMNKVLRQWLLGKLHEPHILLGALLNEKDSPFWSRIFGSIKDSSDEKCYSQLKPVLKSLKVDKMIIGHTPQFLNEDGINNTCDGTLHRIDFGGSFAFHKYDESFRKVRKIMKHRQVQVLEILNDNEFHIITPH